MARKRSSKLEEFSQLYGPVLGYKSFFEAHRDGNGDLEELINFWAVEMKKDGASDQDIQDAVPSLRDKYIKGERNEFVKPGLDHKEEAENKFSDYAKDNLTGIVNSTDEGLLEEMIPGIIQKYQTDSSQYKEFEGLINKRESLKKKLKKLESSETRDEVLNQLVAKKKEYYEKAYADNEKVRDVFVSLISPEVEVGKLRADYKDSSDKIKEQIGSVKGYINSLGLTGDDIVSLYTPIIEESYKRASNSGALAA
jgi:uncharacterized phage infection (PIP) family protein YhgE